GARWNEGTSTCHRHHDGRCGRHRPGDHHEGFERSVPLPHVPPPGSGRGENVGTGRPDPSPPPPGEGGAPTGGGGFPARGGGLSGFGSPSRRSALRKGVGGSGECGVSLLGKGGGAGPGGGTVRNLYRSPEQGSAA